MIRQSPLPDEFSRPSALEERIRSAINAAYSPRIWLELGNRRERLLLDAIAETVMREAWTGSPPTTGEAGGEAP